MELDTGKSESGRTSECERLLEVHRYTEVIVALSSLSTCFTIDVPC